MRKIGASLITIFRLPPWLAFGLAAVVGGFGSWQLTIGGIGNLQVASDIATRAGIDLTQVWVAADIFTFCLKISGGLAIYGLLSVAFGKAIAATPMVAAIRAAALDDDTDTPSYIVQTKAKVKRTYAFHDNLQRRMGQNPGRAATVRKTGGFGAALRRFAILTCLGGLGLVGASVLLSTPATGDETTVVASATDVADLTTTARATITDTLDWALPLGRAWFDATLADAKDGDIVARAKMGALALGGFLFLMQLKKLLFGRKRRRPKTLQEQFA